MYNEFVGKNLSGMTFEDMLVLRERREQKYNHIVCDCLCSCGEQFTTSRHSILKRNRRHCVKCSKKIAGRKRTVDLTGKRFGRLFVIGYYGSDGRRSLWLCECDCGNIVIVDEHNLATGNKSSCGCLQADLRGMNKFTDLSGRRYTNCTVLYRTESNAQGARWVCLCDCGELFIASSKQLNSGHKTDCGKHKGEKLAEIFREDLTGNRYDHVVVTGLAPRGNSTKVLWYYLCDCGRVGITSATNLKSGLTTSCGYCIRPSRGEERIESVLNKYNIRFDRQKKFIGCKNIASLRFDFYLPDCNMAIEYDGEFHYKETSLGNDLEGQRNRDAIKTKYCAENNIVLLRIPYWEKDNIESFLNEWLFFYEEDNKPNGLL